MRQDVLAAAAMIGFMGLGLTACTTRGEPAVVTRISMPVLSGQSFQIVAGAKVTPGSDFDRYAKLVSDRLEARGLRAAHRGEQADLAVQLDYKIRSFLAEGYVSRNWSRDRSGNELPARHEFLRTRYNGNGELRIIRRADSGQLFSAASTIDRDNASDTLVPRMIDAMFARLPKSNG